MAATSARLKFRKELVYCGPPRHSAGTVVPWLGEAENLLSKAAREPAKLITTTRQQLRLHLLVLDGQFRLQNVMEHAFTRGQSPVPRRDESHLWILPQKGAANRTANVDLTSKKAIAMARLLPILADSEALHLAVCFLPRLHW